MTAKISLAEVAERLGESQSTRRANGTNRPDNADEWLWARTDRSNPSGCWEWNAYRARTGYGLVRLSSDKHGMPRYTHRLAYELAKGPIPEGMEVCHSCDNPPCINPDHLFLGTRRDNMRDAVRKGRVANGARLPQTKLTAADIPAIRARIPHEKLQSIADDYGVTYSAIYRIKHGQTWKHVPEVSDAA